MPQSSGSASRGRRYLEQDWAIDLAPMPVARTRSREERAAREDRPLRQARELPGVSGASPRPIRAAIVEDAPRTRQATRPRRVSGAVRERPAEARDRGAVRERPADPRERPATRDGAVRERPADPRQRPATRDEAIRQRPADLRERTTAPRERPADPRSRATPAPRPRATATSAPTPVVVNPTPAAAPNGGVPGRRTVTITGRGAERYEAPTSSRRRPQRPVHERPGFKPDRAAMWAVLLGVLLVLIAATSSHAAVRAAHSVHRAAHVTARVARLER